MVGWIGHGYGRQLAAFSKEMPWVPLAVADLPRPIDYGWALHMIHSAAAQCEVLPLWDRQERRPRQQCRRQCCRCRRLDRLHGLPATTKLGARGDRWPLFQALAVWANCSRAWMIMEGCPRTPVQMACAPAGPVLERECEKDGSSSATDTCNSDSPRSKAFQSLDFLKASAAAAPNAMNSGDSFTSWASEHLYDSGSGDATGPVTQVPVNDAARGGESEMHALLLEFRMFDWPCFIKGLKDVLRSEAAESLETHRAMVKEHVRFKVIEFLRRTLLFAKDESEYTESLERIGLLFGVALPRDYALKGEALRGSEEDGHWTAKYALTEPLVVWIVQEHGQFVDQFIRHATDTTPPPRSHSHGHDLRRQNNDGSRTLAMANPQLPGSGQAGDITATVATGQKMQQHEVLPASALRIDPPAAHAIATQGKGQEHKASPVTCGLSSALAKLQTTTPKTVAHASPCAVSLARKRKLAPPPDYNHDHDHDHDHDQVAAAGNRSGKSPQKNSKLPACISNAASFYGVDSAVPLKKFTSSEQTALVQEAVRFAQASVKAHEFNYNGPRRGQETSEASIFDWKRLPSGMYSPEAVSAALQCTNNRIRADDFKALCRSYRLPVCKKRLELARHISIHAQALFEAADMDEFDRLLESINHLFSIQKQPVFGHLLPFRTRSNYADANSFVAVAERAIQLPLVRPWVAREQLTPALVSFAILPPEYRAGADWEALWAQSKDPKVYTDFSVSIQIIPPAQGRLILLIYHVIDPSRPCETLLQSGNLAPTGHSYLSVYFSRPTEDAVKASNVPHAGDTLRPDFGRPCGSLSHLYSGMDLTAALHKALPSAAGPVRVTVTGVCPIERLAFQLVVASPDPSMYDSFAVKENELQPATMPRLTRDAVLSSGIFSPQDPDEHVGLASMSVSLRCPVSLALIKAPVRSSCCGHLQCLDLVSVNSLLSRKNSHSANGGPFQAHKQQQPTDLECPICFKRVPVASLCYDDYFAQVVAGAEGKHSADGDPPKVTIDPRTGTHEYRQEINMTGDGGAPLGSPRQDKRPRLLASGDARRPSGVYVIDSESELDDSRRPVLVDAGPLGASWRNPIILD